MPNPMKLEQNGSIVSSTSTLFHETEQIVSVKNNRAVTTSLIVAEKFNKLHKNVIRAIKNLDCTEGFNRLNFEPVEYVDAKGEKRIMYYMTRDGFAFLVMGFTGKTAARFKEAYINAFNEMEEMLRKQECTKYAEKLIDAEIQRFNKRMKDAALSLRKSKGNEYGPYGEIQTGVYSYPDMPLHDKLRNIFAQFSNTYIEAYYLAGKYLTMEKDYNKLRQFIASIEGKMAEHFRIFPDL